MTNITSVAVLRKQTKGAAREVLFDLTFSGNYLTGGDTFDAASLAKLGAITLGATPNVDIFEAQPDAAGNKAVLDIANSKVKLFTVAGVEAVNGTDQSAVKIRCKIEHGGTTGR